MFYDCVAKILLYPLSSRFRQNKKKPVSFESRVLVINYVYFINDLFLEVSTNFLIPVQRNIYMTNLKLVEFKSSSCWI